MLEKLDEKVAESQEAKAAPMSFTLTIVYYVQKVAGFIKKANTKIKILVSLWQILGGIGATFSIPFPPFYEQAVSTVGGILQIELPSLMPLDCMISTNFYDKLIFKCVWPICAYAALMLLSKILRKCGKAGRADACVDFAFFLMVRNPPKLVPTFCHNATSNASSPLPFAPIVYSLPIHLQRPPLHLLLRSTRRWHSVAACRLVDPMHRYKRQHDHGTHNDAHLCLCHAWPAHRGHAGILHVPVFLEA